MKKKLITLIPYILVLAADFYLLPLIMKDTGTAMVMILCVMPLIAFICSVVCGMKHGFVPLLAGLAVVLFLPTVFLYYNASAWVYALVYGAVVLAGNAVGRVFYRKR